MRKVFRFFTLFLVLSGCITPPPPPPTDSSLTIETSVGLEFQIVLEADHSYHWSISSELSNAELVGSQYRPRMTKRAPRPGVEIWTFRALSAGDATITFRLETKDGSSPAPAQTVSFTVSVK